MKRDDVVVITGASSGIGESLAVELSKRGYRTVLLARRSERTGALAERLGGDARSLAVSCDVTRDGDLEAAFEIALSRFGRIDAVVANAGFGVDGPMDRLTLDDYRRQFETNVFGVLRTAMVAREPLARTRGALAIVGSVAAFVPAAGVSAYNMSKAAVKSLAETLNAEWAPAGVAVLHVAPGFIRSEIRRIDRKGVVRDESKDPIPMWMQMPSEKAASLMADALEARDAELVLTYHGKLGVWLSRRTPRLLRGILRFAAGRVSYRKSP